MTTTEKASGAGVGLRSERGPVLLGIMLTTSLVALDATIIATAVPSIVGEIWITGYLIIVGIRHRTQPATQ